MFSDVCAPFRFCGLFSIRQKGRKNGGNEVETLSPGVLSKKRKRRKKKRQDKKGGHKSGKARGAVTSLSRRAVGAGRGRGGLDQGGES